MRQSGPTHAAVLAAAKRTMQSIWYRYTKTVVDGPYGSTNTPAKGANLTGRFSPIMSQEIPISLVNLVLNRSTMRFAYVGAIELQPDDMVGNSSATVMFEVIGLLDPPLGQTGQVVHSALVAQVK